MNMDTQKVKTDLVARLNELNERLGRLKTDAVRSYSSDSSEMAQERENDEVVDALGNETQEEIRKIQKALTRIEEDSYGSCQKCGQPIAEGRLAILPEAILCTDCA